MMDLDQLQSVRDRERSTDTLQQLRDSFYEDTAELLADLRDRRAAAAAEADDPFSDPTVARLTDRIDTAEQTVEAIYEKRVGKIVKAASFAAADMPTDVEGLTAEERDLFDTLVEDIRANRERVLAVLEGSGDEAAAARASVQSTGDAAAATAEESGGDTDSASPTDTGETRHQPPEEPEAPPPLSAAGEGDDPGPPAAGPDGTGGPDSGVAAGGDGPAARSEIPGDEEASSGPEADPDLERTTVKITADVGEIFGVDEQEYHLAAGDVVHLPTANAEPLLERDAAEPVE